MLLMARNFGKAMQHGCGTTLVKDINTGTGNSGPDQLVNVNGTLFFRAIDAANGQELWKSGWHGCPAPCS